MGIRDTQIHDTLFYINKSDNYSDRISKIVERDLVAYINSKSKYIQKHSFDQDFKFLIISQLKMKQYEYNRLKRNKHIDSILAQLEQYAKNVDVNAESQKKMDEDNQIILTKYQ